MQKNKETVARGRGGLLLVAQSLASLPLHDYLTWQLAFLLRSLSLALFLSISFCLSIFRFVSFLPFCFSVSRIFFLSFFFCFGPSVYQVPLFFPPFSSFWLFVSIGSAFVILSPSNFWFRSFVLTGVSIAIQPSERPGERSSPIDDRSSSSITPSSQCLSFIFVPSFVCSTPVPRFFFHFFFLLVLSFSLFSCRCVVSFLCHSLVSVYFKFC